MYDSDVETKEWEFSLGLDGGQYDSEIRDEFESHFKNHALDEEVVSELYYLPFATIYGSDERPYVPNTIAESIRMLQREAVVPEEVLVYELLFKGVAKNRKMPILIQHLTDVLQMHKGKTTVTTAHPVCIPDGDAIVKFTVKNLVKHLNFPEIEAKAFYKNITKFGSKKYYFIKNGVMPKDHWNVFSYNYSKENLVIWRTPQKDLKLSVKKNHQIGEDQLDTLIKKTDLDIPISSLAIWKRIAKKRYERINGGCFENLDEFNKKRRLVNIIRHNSTYTELWLEVNAELVDYAHDLAFDRLARKIIRQFPYLANEAQRQLSKIK